MSRNRALEIEQTKALTGCALSNKTTSQTTKTEKKAGAQSS